MGIRQIGKYLGKVRLSVKSLNEFIRYCGMPVEINNSIYRLGNIKYMAESDKIDKWLSVKGLKEWDEEKRIKRVRDTKAQVVVMRELGIEFSGVGIGVRVYRGKCIVCGKLIELELVKDFNVGDIRYCSPGCRHAAGEKRRGRIMIEDK